MGSANIAALAGATARACAFAATIPLLPYGATPRTVRGVLALTLVPLILLNAKTWLPSHSLFSIVIEEGAIGAAFGLCAAAIAGAVIAAGDAIDGALGSAAFFVRTGGDGPISRLYQIAFAFVFLESGGFEAMIVRFVSDAFVFPHNAPNWQAVEALGRASLRASLALAGPSLLAQALATIVAGCFNRAAPQINGILFSAPMGSGAVLLALAAGAVALWPELVHIGRQAIAAPGSLLP